MKAILVLTAFVLAFSIESYGQSTGNVNHRQKSKNDDRTDQFLKSGISKFKKKDYDGALSDFENYIKENPSDYKGYRWKGDALEGLNMHSEAIAFYSLALKLNKNDTLSYRGRADSKRMNHDYKESIGDYNLAIALDSTVGMMYFGRAVAYYEVSNYKLSIANYTRAIRLYPKWSLVRYARAGAYAANHQYQEAKVDIKKYFEMGGKDEAAYYYRGMANIFLSGGNVFMLDSAIGDLKRYTNSKEELARNDYNAHQLLGVAYAKVGDSTNSRRSFKRSLELNPKSMTTYGRWGSSEVGFGNYNKADQLLSISYKMLNAPDGASSDFYYTFALAKVGLQDTVAAVDFFGKCIKADSNRHDAYESRLSFIYSNPKYNRIILHDLQQLIRMSFDEGQKAEWYSMKSLIYYRGGQLDSASSEVNKAVGLMPNEPLHYMIRAMVNASSNQPSEIVLKDIDKAIHLHPSSPEAYMLKASYYALKKDHKHGCEALKQALEMGGNVPKDVRDYVCKGKLPKGGKTPQLYVPLSPKLEKNLQDLNGPDW